MRMHTRFMLCMMALSLVAARNVSDEPMENTLRSIAETLDREDRAIVGGRAQPIWLDDGRLIYSSDGPRDLTFRLYDPYGETERILVEDGTLRSMLGSLTDTEDKHVEAHADGMSGDGRTLYVRSGGHHFSIDVEDGTVLPSPERTEQQRNRQPRIISDQLPTTFGNLVEVRSPDAKHFITLVDHDLALRDLEGTSRQLTRDGTPLRTWRNTEESGQSFNIFWAPDNRRIAAVRLDISNVPHEPVLHWLTRVPTVERIAYPRAGEPIHRFELFIIDTHSSKRLPIETVDTTDCYVNILGWLGDGDSVLYQVIDREQKHLRIFKADARTGASRLILEERRRTYIDTPMTLAPPLVAPLRDSTDFLYLTERTGWRRIERRTANGRLQHALTAGEWPVLDIVAVDEDGGWVYFRAAPDQNRPHAAGLYRVGLAGGLSEPLITSSNVMEASLSPRGDYLWARYSDLSVPPVVELMNVSGSKRQVLSRADARALHAYGIHDIEAFSTPSPDGMWTLHGTILKPRNFDVSKRYPVVEIIYGGMQLDFIPRDFYGFGRTGSGYNGTTARLLVNAGFVVVYVNAPGTPNRGRAFQDATYGIWPDTVIANHAHWLNAAAAERPWMDLSRLGVFGSSWGGYMAQRAMIERPDLYRAAVAMAAPADFIDHPTYIEPFMGLPESNPHGYAAGSNLRRVSEIKGPILLMPMPLDVNAGFSPSMKFLNAMVEAGKDVELFTLPEVNHRVTCCGERREHYSYAIVVRYLHRRLNLEQH